jgi:hypothetical protein
MYSGAVHMAGSSSSQLGLITELVLLVEAIQSDIKT